MIPGIFELLSAREVHARGSVAEPVFVFVFTFFFCGAKVVLQTQKNLVVVDLQTRFYAALMSRVV